MAQKTIVDYETVERERTVTVCDECGKEEGESSAIIPVAINPQTKGFAGITSSASLDMCLSCASDFFDIDIPDGDRIENVQLKDGNMNIEVIIEKKALFSSLEYRAKKNLIIDVSLLPLVILSALVGEGEWYEEENENYALLIGILGTILWGIISFGIYSVVL